MNHSNNITLQNYPNQPNQKQIITHTNLKKYNTIHYNTRKQLIKRVLSNNEKLTEVSNQLGIKLSTSKFIIKSFKKYGRIFKKKCLKNNNEENSVDQKELKCQKSIQKSSLIKSNPQIIYYPFYIYVPVYIPSQHPTKNITVQSREETNERIIKQDYE